MLHNKRMEKSFMEYPYHEMLMAVREYFSAKGEFHKQNVDGENALFSFMLLFLPVLVKYN